MDTKNFSYALYKRLVSAVTLVAFCFSIIAGDFEAGSRAWADTGSTQPGDLGSFKVLDPMTFELPANLGTVKDLWTQTPGDRRSATEVRRIVVHIQDAHCNYYAQHKINDIIRHLKSQYGISAVNLEGGAGAYDLSVFTRIEEKDIREKVSDRFVKEGLVNGAEYFAVNNPDDVNLWGIEDAGLYKENLACYRDSLADKGDIERVLGNLGSILDEFKRKVYSEELYEFDGKFTGYKKKELEFKEYLGYLTAKAREKLIDMGPFANIGLILETMGMEGGIDFERANKERELIIDDLGRRLSKNAVRELAAKTVEFRNGSLSRNDFYGYLFGKAGTVQIDLGTYPELAKYAEYARIYEAADRSKVMSELSGLETLIKVKLFRNGDEKELEKLSRHFTLLRDLFGITLTFDDHRYYKENEEAFAARNYVSFIEGAQASYGIRAGPDRDLYRLDAWRKEIAPFYEYSFARDEAFIKNMRFSSPGKSMPEVCALVTGGFHSENLKGLFRKENISYISVMPSFLSEAGYASPYHSLLGGRPYGIMSVITESLSNIAIVSKLNQLGVEVDGDDTVFKLAVRVYEAMEKNRDFKINTPFGAYKFTLRSGDSDEKGFLERQEVYTLTGGEKLYVDIYKGQLEDADEDNVRIDLHKVTYDVAELTQDQLIKKAHDGEDGLTATELDINSLISANPELGPIAEKLRQVPGLWIIEGRDAGGRPGEALSIKNLDMRGHASWRGIHIVRYEKGKIDINAIVHELGAYFGMPHSYNMDLEKAVRENSDGLPELLNRLDLEKNILKEGQSENRDFERRTADIGADMWEEIGSIASLSGYIVDKSWKPDFVTGNDSSSLVLYVNAQNPSLKFLLKRAPTHNITAEFIAARCFLKAGLAAPRMRFLEIDGKRCLMMEYFEGYSTAKSQEEITDGVQAGFLLDLLLYNHDRTPQNVMVPKVKGKGEPKFIDFGAALFARGTGGAKGLPAGILDGGDIREDHRVVWDPEYSTQDVVTAYDRAYHSKNAKGSPDSYNGLKSSLMALVELNEGKLDAIVDEAFKGVNSEDFLAALSVAAKSTWQKEKYASAQETLDAINNSYGGDVAAYLKHALANRRRELIEYFAARIFGVKFFGELFNKNFLIDVGQGKGYIDEGNIISGGKSIFGILSGVNYKFGKQFFAAVPEIAKPKEPQKPPTVRIPERSMDVTKEYGLDVEPRDKAMTREELLVSVRSYRAKMEAEIQEKENAAQGDPAAKQECMEQRDGLRRAFLEMEKMLTSTAGTDEFVRMRQVGVAMASVIESFRQNAPEGFVVHCARDMGYTLHSQRQLEHSAGNKDYKANGGSLYLNRGMMGGVYDSLSKYLTGLYHKHTPWDTADAGGLTPVDKWFEEGMNGEDKEDYLALYLKTIEDLKSMGALAPDRKVITIWDTGFTGTMPAYIKAAVRYHDRLNGITGRLVRPVILSSAASMEEAEVEFQRFPELKKVFHDKSSLASYIEDLGDQRMHPVFFRDDFAMTGKGAWGIEPEKPANRLYAHLLALMHVNGAIELLELDDASKKAGLGTIVPDLSSILDSAYTGGFMPTLSVSSIVSGIDIKSRMEKKKFTGFIAKTGLDGSIFQDIKALIPKPKPFGKLMAEHAIKTFIDGLDVPGIKGTKDYEIFVRDAIDMLGKHKELFRGFDVSLGDMGIPRNIMPLEFTPLNIKKFLFKNINIIPAQTDAIFHPKRKPFGFIGMVIGASGWLLSASLYASGMIGAQVMHDMLMYSTTLGALLIAGALAYRVYLGQVRDGERPDRDRAYDGYDEAQMRANVEHYIHGGIRHNGVIGDGWRRPGVPDPAVTIVRTIEERDLNDARMINEINRCVNLGLLPWTTDHYLRIFDKLGFLHINVRDEDNDIDINTLYVRKQVPGSRMKYVNNALYEHVGNVLYVTENTARADDMAFGLMMAHEKGKRDVYRLLSGRRDILKGKWGMALAEIAGGVYELIFFAKLMIHRNFTPAALIGGASVSVSILLGLTGCYPLVGMFSAAAGVVTMAAVIAALYAVDWAIAAADMAVSAWRGFLRAVRTLDISSIPWVRNRPLVLQAFENVIIPALEETAMFAAYYYFGPMAYIKARAAFVALHALQDRNPPAGKPRNIFEKTLIPIVISAAAITVLPLANFNGIGKWIVFAVGLAEHIIANTLVTYFTDSRLQKGVIGFGGIAPDAGTIAAQMPGNEADGREGEMFDENGNIRLEYLRSRQSNKVDREILEDWVETPLNNLVREARRRIVDNLRHVSQDDFETKLKQMTEALNSLIGRMAGDSSYAVAFGSQYNKSNRWVYELARRDLAKKPADVLYTHDIRKDRILDNASCVVYFDDMSASGQQLEQNLSMINRLDKRYIIAIPYISTRALEKIGELKKQGYTIELVPGYEVMKTVGEVLKDMDKYVLGLKDGHPDLMTSLYYFDHRIPDSKSFFLSEMFANKRIKGDRPYRRPGGYSSWEEALQSSFAAVSGEDQKGEGTVEMKDPVLAGKENKDYFVDPNALLGVEVLPEAMSEFGHLIRGFGVTVIDEKSRESIRNALQESADRGDIDPATLWQGDILAEEGNVLRLDFVGSDKVPMLVLKPEAYDKIYKPGQGEKNAGVYVPRSGYIAVKERKKVSGEPDYLGERMTAYHELRHDRFHKRSVKPEGIELKPGAMIRIPSGADKTILDEIYAYVGSICDCVSEELISVEAGTLRWHKAEASIESNLYSGAYGDFNGAQKAAIARLLRLAVSSVAEYGLDYDSFAGAMLLKSKTMEEAAKLISQDLASRERAHYIMPGSARSIYMESVQTDNAAMAEAALVGTEAVFKEQLSKALKDMDNVDLRGSLIDEAVRSFRENRDIFRALRIVSSTIRVDESWILGKSETYWNDVQESVNILLGREEARKAVSNIASGAFEGSAIRNIPLRYRPQIEWFMKAVQNSSMVIDNQKMRRLREQLDEKSTLMPDIGHGVFSMVHSLPGYPGLVFKTPQPFKSSAMYIESLRMLEIAERQGLDNCDMVIVDGIPLIKIPGFAPFLYVDGFIIQQKAMTYQELAREGGDIFTTMSGHRDILLGKLGARGIAINDVNDNLDLAQYGYIGGMEAENLVVIDNGIVDERTYARPQAAPDAVSTTAVEGSAATQIDTIETRLEATVRAAGDENKLDMAAEVISVFALPAFMEDELSGHSREVEKLKQGIGRALKKNGYGDKKSWQKNDVFYLEKGAVDRNKQSMRKTLENLLEQHKEPDGQLKKHIVIYAPADISMLGGTKAEYEEFIEGIVGEHHKNITVIRDSYTDTDFSPGDLDKLKAKGLLLPDPTARYMIARKIAHCRSGETETDREESWKALLSYLGDISDEEKYEKPDFADWNSWFSVFTPLSIRPIDYSEITDYIASHTEVATSL